MSKSSKEAALAEALRQARDASSQVSDAARKIWLAGLGALAKANAGGGELFGKLMKQGAEFEASARKNAGDRLKETRETLEDTVERASKQSKETWIKVEKAVSEQVKRSLDKLGVPGQEDLDAIHTRLDQIAAGVRKAAAARSGVAPAAAKSNPPPSSKKAAAPAASKATPAAKKAVSAAKPAAPVKKSVATAKSKPVAAKKAVTKAAPTAPKKTAAAAKKAVTATTPAAATKKAAAKPALAPAISKAASAKKAGATIAAKRATTKSSLPKPPPVARKRDEIADIAAELETAQLAARVTSKSAPKKK